MFIEVLENVKMDVRLGKRKLQQAIETSNPSKVHGESEGNLHKSHKPDFKFILHNYAPTEPLILLPNHYLVGRENVSLDSIVESMESYLETNGIKFISTGHSWSGECESKDGASCSFRICIYKSKKCPGRHIIESQRLRGDDEFLVYGKFYSGLKKVLIAL